MVAAASASNISTTASSKPVPRLSSCDSNIKKTAATKAAHSQTTPFSPQARWRTPSTTSYSHSQANQGWPCMVEEYGSVRGNVCLARICSPVRMCHPISASANGRFDKETASKDQNRNMKMRSRTEGSRKRKADELGSAEGIKGRRSSVCGGRLRKLAECFR